MKVSMADLDEYSRRLDEGRYGRGNSCLSALLNVQSEALISDIRELRRGIGQIAAYAKTADETYEIYEELQKLLDGKF